MCRAVSSSAIARASGRDLASRSSFGHHQGVAGPAGGQCLAEPGSLAVGAGQAVVDVDPFLLDTQTGQAIVLRSQILLIGGASGVPDKWRAHGAPP